MTNCGKFLKRWEYQTVLSASWENTGQEATVRPRYGTMDWFQIGKGVRQGCILSSYLFIFSTEYIMRNARLDESQAGIKIAGRSINNLRYAGDTTNIMTEGAPWWRWKGGWKSWVKTQYSKNEDHGIQSLHFMENRLGKNGNSSRSYFLGFQNPCGWWLQLWN